jgi:hypothetical protein
MLCSVRHLAGKAPDSSLLVFDKLPGQDWQVVNVSKIAGESIAEVPTD